MSITENTPAGENAGGVATVEIAGRRREIERPSTLKGTWAMALFNDISEKVPELLDDLSDFRKKYMEKGVEELTRTEAKMEFPPRPIIIDDVIRCDEDGRPLMLPSKLDSITEEDWERSGHVLKMPGAEPTPLEMGLVIFERAFKAADEQLYKFLALFLVSNADLKAYRIAGGSDNISAQLADEAEQLLDDSFLDEIPELAVAIAEVMESNLRRKIMGLGARVGEALASYGIETDWTPKKPIESDDSPSASASDTTKPGSSTASPESTDGPPTPSSTLPTTSSSISEDSSTETSSASETPTTKPDSPKVGV